MDFGAVQNAYYSTFLGGSTTIGTFGYMPLEQANGNSVPASDLYSLGATLLALVTRCSPEKFCQGLRFEIPTNLNLSEEFTDWLETLLEPDVDERFLSAKEALNALQNSPKKSKDKKVWIVGIATIMGIGLVMAASSSLSMFNQDKWAILNRLGFPIPNGLCYDRALTINYGKTGGRFPEISLSECIKWGIMENLPEIIEVLIDQGADVNYKYGRSNYQTPLHLALSSNQSEIIELLIQNGANINAQDKNGQTPLHLASQSNNLDKIEVLIQSGADINAQDREGKTPLDYAIEYGYQPNIDLLINHRDKATKN
ncbi:MAG: ankyrin repeat domain-containing protein [Microcystaceae cyanobacterium]